jgi:hypothetical protein
MRLQGRTNLASLLIDTEFGSSGRELRQGRRCFPLAARTECIVDDESVMRRKGGLLMIAIEVRS